MKIAFIGGGNMATALVTGLAGKLAAGGSLHVVDPHQDALDKLRERFGVSTATVLDERVAAAEVIVLAVKPQNMRDVTRQLAPLLAGGAQPLVITIAAGIRMADLARWLDGYGAIVRCMPNTPALIGQGITGMAAAGAVSAAQRASADAILRAVGATVWLDSEEQIDAVTALSGSGPAYVFYFMEAMQQAAVELGLSQEQGIQLALATFSGASQLAQQSGEPAAVLRERVTSKGGTTFAAITSMDAASVKAGFVTGIKAAAARARELGDELGAAG